MASFLLLLHLLATFVELVTDLPVPQVVVRSQSLLYNDQPGRQVDLSRVLPTSELFWLNIEEGYFACQVNASEKYLKLFKLSRLCDGVPDCFEASDELTEQLKCTTDCQPTCGENGVCLQKSRYVAMHCKWWVGGERAKRARPTVQRVFFDIACFPTPFYYFEYKLGKNGCNFWGF